MVAVGLAGATFITNVAAAHAVEKSLWEERRSARDGAPRYAGLLPPAPGAFAGPGSTLFDGGSSPSQPPSNFKHLALPFDLASAVLPYGAIGEVREGRREAPVVFLVQDVHGNDGAQKNIGGLLGELSNRGVTLAGVEGAWGPLRLDPFRRHPSPPTVARVAESFRQSGRLSGSEWAGLTAPRPPRLVGVETRALYQANVAAARECVARRPAAASFLRTLAENLRTQKQRLYSPPLKAFDLHREAFEDGREGFSPYARFLSRLSGAPALAGPQVKKFLTVLDWEARLDLKRVEADRRRLMERLSSHLGTADLNGLLRQAAAYRAGKMTNGDFFASFQTLCEKSHLSLASDRAFFDYVSFLGLAQTIRRGDLLKEFSAWETVLGDRLASNPDEKKLLAMDRDAALLRRLLENEMSPEHWAAYENKKELILALPARLSEFSEGSEPPGGLAAFCRSHEQFCRLAMERNNALAANFMAQVRSAKASAAVLVTGGFHTAGLQAELRRNGCSTVVITPRTDPLEGHPLDVFARDPVPFDQFFAGKPISLSPELLLGSPRKTVLELALAGEGMTLNGLAAAVEGWVSRLGIRVAERRLLAPGVVEFRFLCGGKDISLVVGSRGDGNKYPTAGERLWEPILLSNGHVLSFYGRRPSTAEPFLARSARFIGSRLKSVLAFLIERSPHSLTGDRSPIGFSFQHGVSLLFAPFLRLSRLWVVPGGDSVSLPSVELVNEEGTFCYAIEAGNQVVGNTFFIETPRFVFLSSVNVSNRKRGYGSAAVLNVAKRAARLTDADRNADGRPVPLVVSRISNPWTFRLLRDRVFQPGTMEIIDSEGEYGYGSDSVWENPFHESDPEFLRLTGKENRNPDSGDYETYFTARGVLRPEFYSDQRTPEKEPAKDLWRGVPSISFWRIRGNHYFIDDENGRPVGKITFLRDGDALRLNYFSTNPDKRKRGFGLAAVLALAREAAALFPDRQENERPFVVMDVVHPRTYRILRDHIFEPGSMEALLVLPNQPSPAFLSGLNWGGALAEKDPRFAERVGPTGTSEDSPLANFHLRGRLRREFYESAGPAKRSHSALLAGFGFPVDPFLGAVLLASWMGAGLFRDSLLHWLAEKNVPLRVRNGMEILVPDLSFVRAFFLQAARRVQVFAGKWGASVKTDLLGRIRWIVPENGLHPSLGRFFGWRWRMPLVTHIVPPGESGTPLVSEPRGSFQRGHPFPAALERHLTEWLLRNGFAASQGKWDFRSVFGRVQAEGVFLFSGTPMKMRAVEIRAGDISAEMEEFVRVDRWEGDGVGFDLFAARSGPSSPAETAKSLWSRVYTGAQTHSLSDRHREAWDFFRSFLTGVAETKGACVLNLGAGLGRLSLKTKEWGLDVRMVGMDLADFTYAPFKPASPWFRGRGERIPLADGRLDAVVDSFTLAYTDWRRVLEEIHRVLKPGGRAALLIHGADSDIVRSTAFLGENLEAIFLSSPFFADMRDAIESGEPFADLEARASSLLEKIFSQATHGWVTDLIGQCLPLTIYDLAAWRRGEITRAQVLMGLVAREQRLLSRVGLGRHLLAGALSLPGTEAEWRTAFTRAGFSVQHLRRMISSGADLGWAVELQSNGNRSTLQEPGEDGFRSSTTDPSKRDQTISEPSYSPSSGFFPSLRSLAELRRRVRYETRPKGSGLSISMFELDGRFVGRAEVKGKRGEIILKITGLPPAGEGYALALMAEAGRLGLFHGGEGTLAVRGGEPEEVEAAAVLLDPASRGSKRRKPERSKGTKSPFLHSAIERSNQRGDIQGSLSVEARRLLWPELAITKEEPDARSVPPLPSVSFHEDSGIVFVVNDGKNVGEIDFFDGGEAILLNDITIRDNKKKRGFGSAALFALAREAALILTPRKNSDGTPVPLEVQDIDNPWTFHFLCDRIFEPGTLEVMVLPPQMPRHRRRTLLDWKGSVQATDVEFDRITGFENQSNRGSYKKAFCARGQLRKEIIAGGLRGERMNLHSQSEDGGDPGFEAPVSGVLSVPGVTVRQRPVIDSLGSEDRWAVLQALLALAPEPAEMKGLEALVNPARLSLEGSLVENLRQGLGVTGNPLPDLSEARIDGLIRQEVASFFWVDFFCSHPLGAEALAARVVEAAQNGDPAAAGAALAAWDDTRPLSGPVPRRVAETLALLLKTAPDQAQSQAGAFAEAYNRVRVSLLQWRLSVSRLGGAGVVLDITPLFESGSSDPQKAQTWFCFSAALAASHREPANPLALVVRNGRVSRAQATELLAKGVPSSDREGLSRAHLLLASEPEAKKVLAGGRLSLKDLRQSPVWQRPLRVVGFAAENLRESPEELAQWPVELIPLPALLGADLERILRRLEFVRICA